MTTPNIIALGVLIFASMGATLPVQAKEARLPCGDYDGVPSHNDCAPVSAKKEAKCQKWLDQHNATFDPKVKDATKKKYIKCVR